MTSPARRAGEQYVERVNAKDLDGLVALFHDDARLAHPVGEFAGPDAIRGFYAEHVLAYGPQVTAVSMLDVDDVCVFELESGAPGSDRIAHAIDHMTVGADGLISRLAIYYR